MGFGCRDKKLVAKKRDLFSRRKVKELLWGLSLLLIYASFFGHFHVMFPYFIIVTWYFRRLCLILVIVTWLFLFCWACIKNEALLFRFLFRSTIQQSDGSGNLTSDTQLLCKLFKNQSFDFANTIEKTLHAETELPSTKKNCAFYQLQLSCLTNRRPWRNATNVGRIWFQLPTHGIPVYNFQVSIQSRNSCLKSGLFSDTEQKVVRFDHQNRGGDRVTSFAKNKLLRKKYKKHSLSSFHKFKLTQTSGSVYAERIVQIKKTNFAAELIKTVDCLINGLGNYTSIFVLFKMKSL